MTVDGFMAHLCAISPSGDWFNPWAGWNETLDVGPHAPLQRAAHLRAYLEGRLETASVLMIAEAPGYQGARFSGIAMTCERTLLGGKVGIRPDDVLHAGAERNRTSLPSAARNEKERLHGFCEPTATMVWGELVKRPGATAGVFLWNAFPFHPHKSNEPMTNRAPTEEEVTANLHVLESLMALFPGRAIVAVGETSKRHLARIGVAATGVRHPANGGAPAFRGGVGRFLDAIGLSKSFNS